MKKTILVSFIFVFILFSISNADNIEKEYSLLKTAEYFTDGPIGVAGKTPTTLIALKKVMKHTNSKSLLHDLIEEANYEGKLYALIGLYFVDYEYYIEEIQRFSQLQVNVRTYEGCILSVEKMRDILRKEGDRVIKLDNNTQTIAEWAKHSKINLENGYIVDFVGGGIPTVVKRYLEKIPDESL
jgi:hypothetical protein